MKRFSSSLTAILIAIYSTGCHVASNPPIEARLQGTSASKQAKGAMRFQVKFEAIRKFYGTVPEFKTMPVRMVEVDFRSVLMRVEGLAKLYRDYYKKDSADDKALAAINARAKELEDALGEFRDAVHIVSVLEASKAPADFIAYAKINANSKTKDFGNFLKKTGWDTQLKSLDAMESNLRKIDWPKKNQDDREYLFNALAYAADANAKTNYPLDDLDRGVHQLRKDLRSILIGIQTVEGLVTLKNAGCPIAEYAFLESSDLAKTKYGILPSSPLESKSCKISSCVYLAVVNHNNHIAEAKDLGLWEEQIAALLKEYQPNNTKAQISKAASVIIRQYPSYKDPFSTAKQEMQIMKRTNVLAELAKELKDCH